MTEMKSNITTITEQTEVFLSKMSFIEKNFMIFEKKKFQMRLKNQENLINRYMKV